MRTQSNDSVQAQSPLEELEPRPILKEMSRVQPAIPRYLWRPYLPMGKLTFLDGNGGVGKSWIACKIAAALSQGQAVCEGTEAPERPTSVIYTSIEDDASELRARWDKIGGDLSRIHFLEGRYEERGDFKLLTLGDVAVIGDAIARTGAGLVVIDPFLAYLPRGHQHAEGARRVASGLVELADRYGCTVLGIRHLTKERKVRGSIELQAAARSTLQAAHLLWGRVLVHTKCNSDQLGPSLQYAVRDGRFEWLGDSSATPEDLASKQRERPARMEAGAFLEQVLAHGPMKASEVEKRAAAMGISPATLKRARLALGIRSERVGFGVVGCWVWTLPGQEQAA